MVVWLLRPYCIARSVALMNVAQENGYLDPVRDAALGQPAQAVTELNALEHVAERRLRIHSQPPTSARYAGCQRA
jgi:hypothetical protein